METPATPNVDSFRSLERQEIDAVGRRLAEMYDIEAAIQLLDAKTIELVNGSRAVFAIVSHASNHLNRRLAAMLRGED